MSDSKKTIYTTPKTEFMNTAIKLIKCICLVAYFLFAILPMVPENGLLDTLVCYCCISLAAIFVIGFVVIMLFKGWRYCFEKFLIDDIFTVVSLFITLFGLIICYIFDPSSMDFWTTILVLDVIGVYFYYKDNKRNT